MTSYASSLQVVGALCRGIHADAAPRASAWTPAQDRRRFYREAATATWANKAESEYTNDADQEKTEDGHPKVVVDPRAGSPAPGQDADGHQPDKEKSVPTAQFVPDSH